MTAGARYPAGVEVHEDPNGDHDEYNFQYQAKELDKYIVQVGPEGHNNPKEVC